MSDTATGPKGRAIAEILRSDVGRTPAEIAQFLRCTESRVYEVRRTLQREGLLDRAGRPSTPKG